MPQTSPARRRPLAVLALAGAALLAVAGAPPARAATPEADLVALGDSYAAGVGSGSRYRADDPCLRSPASYPAVVARSEGLALTLAACSGATTADVLADQTRWLAGRTRYVTLTVGGNDLGFAPVLTTCALPGWLGSCRAALAGSLSTLRGALPARLDAVLAAVRDRSPGATVVVTGYPRLFGDDDCSALTFFSDAERSRLDAATDELDALVQTRTRAAGLRYVDPRPAFAGHAWCERPSFVNGPGLPRSSSFHPTSAGHAAYADLVGPALGVDHLGLRESPGPTAPTTAAPATAAAAGLPAATTGQQTRAGAFSFAVPALGTAATTRASLAAGLTRAELARFRRAVRAGADRATLERLDATLTRRAAARGTGHRAIKHQTTEPRGTGPRRGDG